MCNVFLLFGRGKPECRDPQPRNVPNDEGRIDKKKRIYAANLMSGRGGRRNSILHLPKRPAHWFNDPMCFRAFNLFFGVNKSGLKIQEPSMHREAAKNLAGEENPGVLHCQSHRVKYKYI